MFKKFNFLLFYVSIIIATRASLDMFREVRISGFNLNTILFGTVFLLNVYVLLLRALKRDYVIPKINLIIILVLGYFATSFFYSVYSPGTLEEVTRIFTLIGICPLVYEVIRTEHDIKKFLKSFGIAILFPLAYGFYQLIFTPEAISYYGMYLRLISTFSHSSTYGDFLVLFSMFFLAFYFYFKEAKRYKTARKVMIILLIILASLLLTYTRGSWIGFVIGSSAMFFLKSKKLFIKYLMVMSAGVLILSPIIIPRLEGELGDTGPLVMSVGGVEVTGSYASRLMFTLYAINHMFMESPIIGKGLGSFFYYYAPANFGYQVETHNDFAKMLGETGIIGFCLYLYLFIYIILANRRFYKTESDPKRKTIFLVTYSMSVFMLYSALTNASLRLLAVQFYFWAFVGFSFSMVKFRSRIMTQNKKAVIRNKIQISKNKELEI